MAKRANVPHILIIRLSAMGDVAMTVPVVLALQRNHPEVKVTVLTKPQLLPIFNSVEGVSVFSANVKTEHKGVFGLWKIVQGAEKTFIDPCGRFTSCAKKWSSTVFLYDERHPHTKN